MFTTLFSISKSRRLKRDALNLRGKFLRNPPITPRTKDVYVSNSVAVQRVGLITCSSPSNERIILPRNDSRADWKLLESGETIPVGTRSLRDHAKWISFSKYRDGRGREERVSWPLRLIYTLFQR